VPQFKHLELGSVRLVLAPLAPGVSWRSSSAWQTRPTNGPGRERCLAANQLWILIQSNGVQPSDVWFGSVRATIVGTELCRAPQAVRRERLGPENLRCKRLHRSAQYYSTTQNGSASTVSKRIYRRRRGPSLRGRSRRRYLRPATNPPNSGSDLPAASSRESSTLREIRSVVIVAAVVSFFPRRCVHGYVL